MANAAFERLAGAALLLGLLTACGDGSTNATPNESEAAGDAGSHGDASSRDDAGSHDAGATRVAECRLLDEPGGNNLSPALIAATPPPLTGGTLADGVYHLTAVNMYYPVGDDRPPSAPMKATLEVTGSSVAIATHYYGPTNTRTMEVRIEDAKLHVLSACDLTSSGERSMVTATFDPIEFSSSTESVTITDAFGKSELPLPDDYVDVTVTHLTFTR